jgi:hypothetical protein
MAGYIAIVPKIAILVVAIRFFGMFIQADDKWVEGILYMMAVVTMTLPNMIALVQTDVKRMLAFSSISHAGFVLVAIMLGTTQALQSLFLYWILFSFVILGAFAMLWLHRTKEAPSFYGFTTDYLLTNMRTLLNAGIKEKDIPFNTPEELEGFKQFVSLHYAMSQREDTEYWKHVTNNVRYAPKIYNLETEFRKNASETMYRLNVLNELDHSHPSGETFILTGMGLTPISQSFAEMECYRNPHAREKIQNARNHYLLKK